MNLTVKHLRFHQCYLLKFKSQNQWCDGTRCCRWKAFRRSTVWGGEKKNSVKRALTPSLCFTFVPHIISLSHSTNTHDVAGPVWRQQEMSFWVGRRSTDIYSTCPFPVLFVLSIEWSRGLLGWYVRLNSHFIATSFIQSDVAYLLTLAVLFVRFFFFGGRRIWYRLNLLLSKPRLW